jgi:PAS domain-containing protein
LLSARQRTALLAFARRSSTNPEVTILVQDAAALVAKVLGADFSGVGTLAADGTLTLTIAETGPAGEFLVRASRVQSLQPELSMAGYAATSASPVASACLATDDRFTDLFLRELGVVSGLTVPLPDRRIALGTFGVYWKTAHEADPDAVGFVEIVAHMLGASLARVKADSERQRQQVLNEMLLTAIDSIVMLLDLQSNLVNINYTGSVVTGFSNNEVQRRPFAGTFLLPEGQLAFESAFAQTLRGHQPVTTAASLVTKGNQRQKIFWTLRELADRSGQAYAVLLVGNDRPDSQFAPQRALAAGQPENLPIGKERRSSPRRGYNCSQEIAPVYDGKLPRKEDLRFVRCNDISRGGLSFYLKQPPDFEELVISLGSSPHLSFFSARVVWVEEEIHASERVYLVGCRFTGRFPGFPAVGNTL